LVGERVLPEDFASFKRHFAHGARFVHAYSLSEVGNVAMSVLTHDSVVPDDILPVGYPPAGRGVRIVDEAGEVVPAGAVGEIVLDNPYAPSADGSGSAAPAVFGTGDLGRMDPDGLLFHLGRRDFQVKVRGFRVEIEGVEATLVRAPGITQSAVVVRNNSQGEPMLVAYAGGDRRIIDAERLRAFAVSHLPEGSVPSRFVVLDALPLTASGKLDRRAINALEDAAPVQVSSESWSHRSVVEQAIALEGPADGPPESVPGPDLVLRLAALFHDIGKPPTRRFEKGGGVSFHHHEVVGAKLTSKRMKAMRYDKDTTKQVSRLVELHLRFHGYGDGQWTDSAVRRYATDAGPLLQRLHRLTRSDCTTRNVRKAQRLSRAYDDLEVRIDRLAAEEELGRVRPELNGNEIAEALGIRPGPVLGEAYDYLLSVRLDDGPIGQDAAREKLLAWWAERAEA